MPRDDSADPFPGDRLFVVAHSPDRQPYLSVRKTFDWPKGAIEHAVDLALPRGVSIRGKVTEEGSGQPIAGAAVRYSVYTKLDANPDNWASPAETSADGSFEFAVAPQPGYLAIGAPSEDYVTQEIGDRLLFEGQPGGRRMYAHAFNVCDPKSDTGGLAFNVVLHRGAFIKGRVVGPDGQPVHDAWMFSRLSSDGRLRLGDPGVPGSTAARDGQFELHGIDPGSRALVYFLEPKRKLGATVHLSGKSPGGPPVTVRLESCGAAKARLVSGDGKPIAVRLPPSFITLVITPGSVFSAVQSNPGQRFADEAALSVSTRSTTPTRWCRMPRGGSRFPCLSRVQPIALSTVPCCATQAVPRSARNSRSSRAKRSTLATFGSKNLSHS